MKAIIDFINELTGKDIDSFARGASLATLLFLVALILAFNVRSPSMVALCDHHTAQWVVYKKWRTTTNYNSAYFVQFDGVENVYSITGTQFAEWRDGDVINVFHGGCMLGLPVTVQFERSER
jgi:hypothetical protein